MFEIGDRIVYPMHGAGVIVEKTLKTILGVEKEYYILSIPVGEIRISVPIDKINDMGIRTIVDESEIENILEILKLKDVEINSNWNARYRENLEKLRLGELEGIAEVFRDLYTLDLDRGLSMAEKKLLHSSKKMLISELSVVEGKKVAEVEKNLENLFKNEEN
ncbi:CarD family transcriptional regulator [Lagierella massiliensis]|uniref:CarD family transcriptional regulator n=1 Tax=Lagierella massiliensis TaxID=1689303 RepID=UPI0006D7CB06|nr:CarD family transcriptional regulator [Lagierella massiliensis]